MTTSNASLAACSQAPQRGSPKTSARQVSLWPKSDGPVMAPLRSLLPNMGGIDFSPILVFIGINVVQIGLRHAALTVGLPPGLVFGL